MHPMGKPQSVHWISDKTATKRHLRQRVGGPSPSSALSVSLEKPVSMASYPALQN